MIHLNPKHPENCNIKLTNLRSNEISIFQDNKWHVADQSEILETVISDKQFILNEYLNRHRERLEERYPHQVQAAEQASMMLDTDKKFKNGLKKKLKYSLYNNSSEQYKPRYVRLPLCLD